MGDCCRDSNQRIGLRIRKYFNDIGPVVCAILLFYHRYRVCPLIPLTLSKNDQNLVVKFLAHFDLILFVILHS